MSIAIFSWPALSLAVENQWGGSESEGKREWLAGVISDMFTERPETDLEDVEDRLLQVMSDEFEVEVDDDSAYEVAQRIMQLRTSTTQGDFSQVDELYRSWQQKKGASASTMFRKAENAEDDDDNDDDDDDDDDEEEEDGDDEDVEMKDEASTAAPPPREKQEPEVDAEGFTKVVSKKKR